MQTTEPQAFYYLDSGALALPISAQRQALWRAVSIFQRYIPPGLVGSDFPFPDDVMFDCVEDLWTRIQIASQPQSEGYPAMLLLAQQTLCDLKADPANAAWLLCQSERGFLEALCALRRAGDLDRGFFTWMKTMSSIPAEAASRLCAYLYVDLDDAAGEVDLIEGVNHRRQLAKFHGRWSMGEGELWNTWLDPYELPIPTRLPGKIMKTVWEFHRKRGTLPHRCSTEKSDG